MFFCDVWYVLLCVCVRVCVSVCALVCVAANSSRSTSGSEYNLNIFCLLFHLNNKDWSARSHTSVVLPACVCVFVFACACLGTADSWMRGFYKTFSRLLFSEDSFIFQDAGVVKPENVSSQWACVGLKNSCLQFESSGREVELQPAFEWQFHVPCLERCNSFYCLSL